MTAGSRALRGVSVQQYMSAQWHVVGNWGMEQESLGMRMCTTPLLLPPEFAQQIEHVCKAAWSTCSISDRRSSPPLAEAWLIGDDEPREQSAKLHRPFHQVPADALCSWMCWVCGRYVIDELSLPASGQC